MQGLPEGYFAQNEEHLKLSHQGELVQSLDDIDRLLKEAGLRVTHSEDE